MQYLRHVMQDSPDNPDKNGTPKKVLLSQNTNNVQGITNQKVHGVLFELPP
jgi:hypothetical protein